MRSSPAWAKGKCVKCGASCKFMIVMLCDQCIKTREKVSKS